MLTLMLGPKFKSMHLITSYVSCEDATSLVVNHG